jgi:hypothetical protein
MPKNYLFAAASFGLSFVLLFASVINIPFQEAIAQQGAGNQQSSSTVHVSFEYILNSQYYGDKQYARYTGTATLTPVDGGFEGIGTGSYEGLDELPPFPPCTEPQLTKYAGAADLAVNAQYSIDNSVTGGPDTSMYNSSTSVIELLVYGENIAAQGTGIWDGSSGCKTESWTTNVGFDCHFYGIDFAVGGVYEKFDEDGNQDTKCKLTIGSISEDLRIFGTASSIFGGLGQKGISNSKVAIVEMTDDYMQALSVSKPKFFSETLTSDNDTSEYEFVFAKPEGKLPRILVVSLLWYVGDPEFAVTNGPEIAGRFIPVYQALCVDDESGSPCEKWTRSATGYEAEVDFEYGNEDKLLQTQTIMDMEKWEGGNATVQVMKDSAYIYYNSYLAVKYFDTLGLPALQPIMIKAHHMDTDCQGAYYDADAKLNSKFPKFGDLGNFLGKVEGTGSAAYLCDNKSALESPDAPVNREWHELGHYLMFQLYPDPYTNPVGINHRGYLNVNTNDSIIEGFAEFVAMLIYEHYGEPRPYIHPIGTSKYNLEVDYKVWGRGIQEEFAVAGILWDIHDSGVETNHGFYLNGTVVQTTNLWSGLKDTKSMNANTMINKIDSSEPKTLVDLATTFDIRNYQSFVHDIFINHGAFPDIVVRDWIYEYNSEEERGAGQSGSLSNPVRSVRYTPAPELPGSNLVSDIHATYNMSIRHDEPFGYYDYSYLVEMQAGEPTYFSMSPEYYPSTLTATLLSDVGEPLQESIQIDSDRYWAYIYSNPPQDGVFRSISAELPSGPIITAVDYIQNVMDLLGHVSQEYRAGNYTGAETLAVAAYIDNFEHIEPDLVSHNATDLKEETEQMLRVELVSLIRDRASQDQVDAKIDEINSRLDHAIAVVPEFPAGLAASLAALATLAVVVSRYSKKCISF